MNRLKTLITGLALTSTMTTIVGQNTNQQACEKRVEWHARLTVGSACMMSVPRTDTRMSYSIGGGADIRLSKNGWRLLPDLQITQKGLTFDGFYGNEQITPASFSTRLNYIEMPVLIGARLKLGKESFITLKLGPYIACGLSGKTTVRVDDTDYKKTFTGNHFSKPCDFNGTAYDKEQQRVEFPKFKRLEIGTSSGVDLTLGHIMIGVNATVGLTNTTDEMFMGSTADQILSVIFLGGGPRNLTAGVTLGYRF